MMTAGRQSGGALIRPEETASQIGQIVALIPVANSITKRGAGMGDKGKKDKGRREEQKTSVHTAKEKRKQKKEKKNSIWQK
jgi:hypothetical protein